MMPANIAATMRKALRASLSLATSEFVADLPHAQRDAAEIGVALAWLEQNCSTVFNTLEDVAVNKPASAPVISAVAGKSTDLVGPSSVVSGVEARRDMQHEIS